MNETTKKAAQIRGPVTGITFAVDVGTSAASVDLSAYAGRWVTLKAEGAKLYYLLAATQTPAEALDPTARSGATCCDYIPADGQDSFEVDITYPRLGYKTSTGTSVLRFRISSERIPA